MTCSRLTWGLAVAAWLAAALSVLKFGDSTGYAASCPLDGAWG
jgi:hypothetical protein